MKYKEKNPRYCEIYSSGAQLAFFTQDDVQCHGFAFCTDYLQDVIWATIHKKPVNIHGFAFDPATEPLPAFEATHLLFRNESMKDFLDCAPKLIKFLNDMESHFGVNKTQMEVDEKTGVIILRGDKVWINHPTLLSFYKLVIRAGALCEAPWFEHLEGVANGKIKSMGPNDSAYLRTALPIIKKWKDSGLEFTKSKIEDNYPADVLTSNLHHRSGIVSAAQGLKYTT